MWGFGFEKGNDAVQLEFLARADQFALGCGRNNCLATIHIIMKPTAVFLRGDVIEPFVGENGDGVLLGPVNNTLRFLPLLRTCLITQSPGEVGSKIMLLGGFFVPQVIILDFDLQPRFDKGGLKVGQDPLNLGNFVPAGSVWDHFDRRNAGVVVNPRNGHGKNGQKDG